MGSRLGQEQVRSFSILRRRRRKFVNIAVDIFHFLETDYSYILEEKKEHFRGDYLWYTSEVYGLSIEYSPEGTGRLSASIWVLADLERDDPTVVDIPSLLHDRAPETDWSVPENDPLTEDQVIATLQLWAAGLKAHAQDILLG